MRIADMDWRMVEDWGRPDDRATLPLGSTEQHAGLSLATDAILAERVAAEAAEPLGVPVFPALPYGLTPYFPVVNGHVGNAPAGAVAQEWMMDNPDAHVRFHDWWRAPLTAAAVRAIDPVASHASWMENSPWTRLPNRSPQEGIKRMVDTERLRAMTPFEVRS